MIDVTTADHYGHWDVEDIKRLCEYRDQLRAALAGLCECPDGDCICRACLALERATEPQSAEHACTCDHEDGHHFDDGNGMVRCRSTADCKCAYPLK